MPHTAPDLPARAEDAFERYVLSEVDVLLRVATSITRDPVDAEDLVQETLIRAYKAIGRFDGRHPRAWLFTIMRNAQRNRVRRRRPELLRDPESQLEQFGPSTEPHQEPAAEVVDPIFEAEVQRAFDLLSPRFRSVVELVDLEGLPYQEAADALGLPVGTVMSRLHRARRRMRSHLDDAGIQPPGQEAHE